MSANESQAAFKEPKDDPIPTASHKSVMSADSDDSLARLTKPVVAVFVVLFAIATYTFVGSPTYEPNTSGQAGLTIDEEDLRTAVARLGVHFENDPSDVEAGGLLYRAQMALQQYDEAIATAIKIREFHGDTPDNLMMEANAVALSGGANADQKVLELAGQALAVDPGHLTSLWIAAIAAENTGDYDSALAFYDRAIEVAEPGLREELRGWAEEARAKSTESVGAQQQAADANPGVVVLVDLAPELAGQVEPEDTLFVLARQVDGPPAPIAVVRMQAGDLPATVSLDDGNSMTAARSLSSFEEAEIVARVSFGGQARAASGDLEGRVVATVGEGVVVRLTISGTLP